jgi:hypothetical protein
MLKALIGLIVSLTQQAPEVVAEYNAYLTLHMVNVYGAEVTCKPFDGDPRDESLHRCVADNEEAYIRLYCSSDMRGPNLCKNYFVVFKD